MRLDDLAIRTQTPIDTDTVLFEKIKSHERVEFDSKTNLYSFQASLPYALLSSRPDTQSSMTTVFGAKRPCSSRRTPQSSKKTGTKRLRTGTPVRTEQGSASRKVRIPNCEVHSLLKRSTMAEFYDLWHNLTVPNDVDLLKQLQSGSMSPPNMAYSVTYTDFSRWSTGD